MDCNEIKNQLIDYIDRTLDEKTLRDIHKHIRGCKNCTKEAEELKNIFLAINDTPQEFPDQDLKINFDKMLEKEKALLSDTKLVTLHQESKKYWKTALQFAATIALIICSFFYGKYQNDATAIEKLAVLKKEKIQLKQQMTMAMIENESASKRLQAVNYAEEFKNPGNDILNALINKMHYDNHINVRLAAAEALAKFSDLEMIRKAFINALDMEQDPDMQLELIQILVSIQEKRAVPPMEKLLQKEETLKYVKDQVKIDLPKLI